MKKITHITIFAGVLAACVAVVAQTPSVPESRTGPPGAAQATADRLRPL